MNLAAVVPPPGGDVEGDLLVMVAEPGSAGQPQQVVFPPLHPVPGSADVAMQVEMPQALGSASDPTQVEASAGPVPVRKHKDRIKHKLNPLLLLIPSAFLWTTGNSGVSL